MIAVAILACWIALVAASLAVLHRSNRRDEEAIIDHEFNRLTSYRDHDIEWDDEQS